MTDQLISSPVGSVSCNYWAVVPAAGVGRRFGGEQSGSTKPKQYRPLLGKSVAQWTLERLLSVECVTGCMVALGSEDNYWVEQTIDDPRISLTTGGAERADTVRLALQALAGRAQPDDWVLVHDIARPCVRVNDIKQLIHSLAEHPVGGLLAVPVADTVKRINAAQQVVATEDRSQLWSALTPQMFRYSLLCDALGNAAQSGLQPTDEAAAIEALGLQPIVVQGQRDNIKITHREDLAIAEAILSAQQVDAQQQEQS